MTHHPLDIPDLLRIPQEVRRASWKGKKLTNWAKVNRPATRHEEAATRKLRREIEAQERAKAKAKAEARKEKRATEKRQRIKPISRRSR